MTAKLIAASLIYAGVALCYYSYIGLEDVLKVWEPELILPFFIAAAVFGFLFALKPCIRVLFELAGLSQILALSAREMDIVISRLTYKPGQHSFQVLAVSFLLNLLFIVSTWLVWQKVILPWHVFKREQCRLRREGG